MHDNAHFHVFMVTHQTFQCKRFTGENIMELRLSSPDLNPMENLWSLSKIKLYDDKNQ